MSYYNCEIKYKDEDSTFVSLIKDSFDIDENTDDQVFFYCNSVGAIEKLMNEDNGQDFIVLNFEIEIKIMKKETFVTCRNCGHEFALKSWGYDKLEDDCAFYAVCLDCDSSFDISDEDAESILIPDGTKVKLLNGIIGIVDGNDFKYVDPEDENAFDNINYHVCPIEFTNEEVWSDHYVYVRREEIKLIYKKINMETMTLLEAFKTMLNGDNIKLDEDVFKESMEDEPNVITNEFTIQSIERDGKISLYSQESIDVFYDFNVRNIHIIE